MKDRRIAFSHTQLLGRWLMGSGALTTAHWGLAPCDHTSCSAILGATRGARGAASRWGGVRKMDGDTERWLKVGTRH